MLGGKGPLGGQQELGRWDKSLGEGAVGEGRGLDAMLLCRTRRQLPWCSDAGWPSRGAFGNFAGSLIPQLLEFVAATGGICLPPAGTSRLQRKLWDVRS